MARLFKVQTTDRVVNQLQDNIANFIEPIGDNVLLPGIILKNVALAVGSNTIQHGLGRLLLGWFIVRQRASASIYDTQDTNTSQTTTLKLTSSAVVTVDIYVF
jgi:hypothetical protein